MENDIIISDTEYYPCYINELSTSWPPDRLFKNDYIKLREVALSYTLPTSFTSKIKVQRMTLSLAARNLFYLHKTIPNVDVESSLGIDSYIENSFYPAVRTFSLGRSEEHTSELQSLMRLSYAVFCSKKKTITTTQ